MTERQRLPNRRRAETRAWEFRTEKYEVGIGLDDAGQIKEIFVTGARCGSDMDSLLDDVSILI